MRTTRPYAAPGESHSLNWLIQQRGDAHGALLHGHAQAPNGSAQRLQLRRFCTAFNFNTASSTTFTVPMRKNTLKNNCYNYSLKSAEENTEIFIRYISNLEWKKGENDRLIKSSFLRAANLGVSIKTARKHVVNILKLHGREIKRHTIYKRSKGAYVYIARSSYH